MRLSDIDLLSVGNTVQLAGAVYAGDGKAYLVMFPDEHTGLRVDQPYVDEFEVVLSLSPSSVDDADSKRLEVLNLDPDDWVRFLRQTDLMETEILAKAAADGPLVKAIVRKSQRQIDQAVSWKVFRRDGYTCRYCARDDVPLTVDHLVLWEEGGPTIEENLLSACRKCNKTRGRLQYVQWLVHPYYAKMADERGEILNAANILLASTLDAIPRRVHIHSR